MEWEELHRRLIQTFTTNGIIGNKVLQVMEHEKAYGSVVAKAYRGHEILSHSFQEFYINTIEMAASIWKDKDRLCTPPTYSESLLWHLGNFRSIRTIDILFHSGYPTESLARLRYLKESALFLGAMLSGLTTYSQIKGLNDSKKITEDDMDLIRKNQIKEERRIFELMLRKKSNLDKNDIVNLKRWEDYFNKETHGAFLTLAFEHGPAIKGAEATSVAPKRQHRSCAMFINRFSEIAWMLHRTLPIMQLSNHPFSDEWKNKWKLLDDNFLMVEKQLAEMNKPIGHTFIRFMETKFPFDAEVCFDTIDLVNDN